MSWVWVVLRQLLIGAVITVVVAWAFALWSPAPKKEYWSSSDPPPPGATRPVAREWVVPIRPDLYHAESWPANPESGSVQRGIGITRIVMASSEISPWFRRGAVQAVVRSGWPWRALCAQKTGPMPSGDEFIPIFKSSTITGRHFVRVRSGVATPLWLAGGSDTFGRPLPLMPVWPGFIADSAFWGCLAWLVHPGIRRVVRHRRYRASRCAYCKHQMLDRDAVCPECGRTFARA